MQATRDCRIAAERKPRKSSILAASSQCMPAFTRLEQHVGRHCGLGHGKRPTHEPRETVNPPETCNDGNSAIRICGDICRRHTQKHAKFVNVAVHPSQQLRMKAGGNCPKKRFGLWYGYYLRTAVVEHPVLH